MKTRLLAFAGVAFAAVSANAAPFIFDFSSAGSFGQGGGFNNVIETNVLDDFSTLAVAGVAYNYVLPVPGATSGTGTILLANSSTIQFAFTGSVTSTSSKSNALNGAVVSFYGGTGTLTGLTGTGSISNTQDWTTSSLFGDSRTTFYGELVPEPASMAALAVGALALARKRRK